MGSTVKVSYEFWISQQYEMRKLRRTVAAFESGERYTDIQKNHLRLYDELNRTIKKLKKDLENERKLLKKVREFNDQANEDLIVYFEKLIKEKDREIAELRKLLAESERQKKAEKMRSDKEKEELRLGLEKAEQEKKESDELNRKLTAQLNKDFENSSIPSSMQTGAHKKITNSRKSTGRKPGGQKGHPGHRSRLLEPTQTREIAAPERILNDPDFVETGKIISKQKVSVRLEVIVDQITTKEYRNTKTGKTWHAAFPTGYENEVNYDGSVKAALYLLMTECNVSIDKAVRYLKEISNDKLDISKGTADHLLKEFSDKTQPEQTAAAESLLRSPVLQTDFTNANVNGTSRQVLIVADPAGMHVKMIARSCKGHKGISGTLLEVYTGTLVHDHDTTFYSYGTAHQECFQHNYRYLKANMENEPEYKWSEAMLKLFYEMADYRNGLGEGEAADPDMVAEYEKRYDEILDGAEEEYKKTPTGKYNKESEKMYRRLRKYKESELLFLHDMSVPSNNSLCERLARVFKRKQKQATVFRSDANLFYVCNGMSVIHDIKAAGKDLFMEMTEIFNRPRPPKDTLPDPMLIKVPDKSEGNSSEKENDQTGNAA